MFCNMHLTSEQKKSYVCYLFVAHCTRLLRCWRPTVRVSYSHACKQSQSPRQNNRRWCFFVSVQCAPCTIPVDHRHRATLLVFLMTTRTVLDNPSAVPATTSPISSVAACCSSYWTVEFFDGPSDVWSVQSQQVFTCNNRYLARSSPLTSSSCGLLFQHCKFALDICATLEGEVGFLPRQGSRSWTRASVTLGGRLQLRRLKNCRALCCHGCQCTQRHTHPASHHQVWFATLQELGKVARGS